jgi:hypothetical protein
LQLSLGHGALCVDPRHFGLCILDSQSRCFIFQFGHSLAGADASADFSHVFQPSGGARGEPSVIATDDAAGHPAAGRDTGHRRFRDFNHHHRQALCLLCAGDAGEQQQ